MEPMEELRNDVKGLKSGFNRLNAWTLRHDQGHLNDEERLNILLRHLEDHTRNHHGRRSAIKQSSLTVAGTTALLAIAGLVSKVTGLLDLFG